MKDKPNKGWVKELSGSRIKQNKKPFNYSKPVSKVDNPNSMAINSRSRAYKSVKADKSTSFVKEQASAKSSHKGLK